MPGKVYRRSRDNNESDIVNALRAVGCTVYRLDGDPGVLDLLVGCPDPEMVTLLNDLATLRAKNPNTAIGDWAGFRRVQLQSRARRWMLLEVKKYERKEQQKKGVALAQVSPGGEYEELGKRYGLRLARQLTLTQAKFLIDCDRLPVVVVSTPEEALEAVGIEAPDLHR
jgi:hypothetical protein